jgi:glycerol-3-phosphate acyltransferase PlsY
LAPAVLTAIFDLSKGLLVMHLASQLGASAPIIHLAGCAAIVGHVFPFYLHFRGGQGVATATAILIYYLGMCFYKGWMPWESLVVLAFGVLLFTYITRVGEFVGIIILMILAVFVLVFSPPSEYQIFLISIILYISFINSWNIVNQGLLPRSDLEMKRQEMNWRHYLRPAAFLLVVYHFHAPPPNSLILVGSVALPFLVLDLSRLFSKDVNIFFFKKVHHLYKSKEYKSFSSITLFLFGIFLSFLLFDKGIALLAVSFLIFGDFFSKFYGLHFGKKQIFGKTLEGSLAHFTVCLITSYLAIHYIAVPFAIGLLGAAVATLSELLPLRVNDNFSVPILSAAVMTVATVF